MTAMPVRQFPFQVCIGTFFANSSRCRKAEASIPIQQQQEKGPGQMEDSERNGEPWSHDQNEDFAGRESAGTKRQVLQEGAGQGEAINDFLLVVMRVSGPLWPVFAGMYLLYRVCRYIRSRWAQAQSANRTSAPREQRLFYINHLPYGLLIVWIVIASGGKYASIHSPHFFIMVALEVLPLVMIYMNLSLRRNITMAKRIVTSFGSGILFSLSTVGIYCMVQTWQP